MSDLKTISRAAHSRAFLLFAELLLSLTAAAQLPPPALLVEEKGHASPLRIAKVEVEARIVGFVAETRMTLVFRNDLNRPLAGDLYFPLPPGATVSGYALDVNGVLVDGVAVEKDKGRQVFEKETRKGVDPGLVEWTRGNHFKTRVFPIPPRGTRTVRVSYVSDILTDAKGSHYALPLNFKDPLATFQLRLEVVKAAVRPVVRNRTTFPLNLSDWRDSFLVEARSTNASATGEVLIELPQVEQQRVLIEKASDGQYYFCVHEFPADPRAAEKTLALPPLSQATIFWDASGSRGAANHQRELDWLKAWFARYHQNSLAVNLVPFRNALAPAQRFTVKNGDAAAVLNAIAQLAYDGGTQLGCLTNYPAAAPGGVYFLFSDGLGNFGQPEPPVLDAPLFLFSDDLTLDQPFLQSLAQRAGGAFFPLRRMTDQQVFAAMSSKPFAFLGAEPADGIVELAAPVSRSVQGRFTLAGKLIAAEAQLVLNYGANGKRLTRSKLTLSRAQAVEGDLLRRFWAQKKLEDLLVLQKRHEPEITELGRQYGLVTPFTSLIVLENVEQYVEHHITPPASLPKMRAEYGRIVEERATLSKQEERRKIEHLLALWKTRVEWWNKKFSYPENFKVGRADPANPPPPQSPRVTALPGMARSPAASGPRVTPLPPGTVATMLEPAPGEAAAPFAQRYGLSKAKASSSSRSTPEPEPGVALKEWNPQTPYLAELKKVAPTNAFPAYLAQRKKFGTSPAFFLDCAEFFRKQKQDDLALQVLSNIAELETENAALLRVLAHRLLQLGRLELACGLFEEVLKLRPEEPQSFRDLALALARRSESTRSRADAVRAMELLAKVVNNHWDRFDEIEVIALMELNALWADFTRRFPGAPATFPADERLQKLPDLDARILLTWDADMTDIDLHVIEPSGERAFYGHNLTTIGGLVSKDFTQGYGPEEYCLRHAMHGTYKVEVNYYGSQAARLMGPVTVQAEVITHFGRPNEKRKSLTLRLEEKKQTVLVGEIEF